METIETDFNTYHENKHSLKCINDIFGGLVKTVYTETTGKINIDNDGSLNFSGCSLILEFVNGTRVKFDNSEWAHMTKMP